MDYQKLVVDLISGCTKNCASCEYAGDYEFECTITKLASSTIANLLIENQALRNAANGFKERAEAAEYELEQKDIYYDQMIDAFAAMDSADLEATKTKLRIVEARAEAIEQDRDRLLEAMKPNCLMCDSMHENGNCTEVGGFCTAIPAAHCPLIPRLLNQLNAEKARADKAEKERDAAIKELDGVSNAVGDLSDFIDDQIYPLIQYDMYAALRDNIYAITTWKKESEWSGIREE